MDLNLKRMPLLLTGPAERPAQGLGRQPGIFSSFFQNREALFALPFLHQLQRRLDITVLNPGGGFLQTGFSGPAAGRGLYPLEGRQFLSGAKSGLGTGFGNRRPVVTAVSTDHSPGFFRQFQGFFGIAAPGQDNSGIVTKPLGMVAISGNGFGQVLLGFGGVAVLVVGYPEIVLVERLLAEFQRLDKELDPLLLVGREGLCRLFQRPVSTWNFSLVSKKVDGFQEKIPLFPPVAYSVSVIFLLLNSPFIHLIK